MEAEALRRLVGAIYLSWCEAVGEETAARANEALYAYADHNMDNPLASALCVALADTQALPIPESGFDFCKHLRRMAH
jgi:hypothetical protein